MVFSRTRQGIVFPGHCTEDDISVLYSFRTVVWLFFIPFDAKFGVSLEINCQGVENFLRWVFATAAASQCVHLSGEYMSEL